MLGKPKGDRNLISLVWTLEIHYFVLPEVIKVNR